MRRAALLALIALGACAGVLGLRGSSVGPFPHRKHVVAGVSCLKCHDAVARAGDDDPITLPTTESCKACHDQVTDVRDPAIAAGAADARAHLRFAHGTHAPELNNNCVRCHSDVATTDGPLRPRMATCLRCHEHDDQFVPEQCDTCHVDLEEEGSLPQSHLVHDGDWLRDHGVRASSEGAMCATCHTEQSCASCHGVTAPAVPARIRFDVPSGDALHPAGFRSHHAEEARADPGVCSTCHQESSCRTCHDEEGVAALSLDGPGTSPHPRGWVGVSQNDHGPAARRDPASCASCHGGAGEQLCVSCHRVGGVGGSPHPAGWETAQPKSALPCRLCHQ